MHTCVNDLEWHTLLLSYMSSTSTPVTDELMREKCFPEIDDTELLADPITAKALAEDIQEIFKDIDFQIAQLFPSVEQSSARRLNLTRVGALRDTLTADLKLSNRELKFATFGSMRAAGKLAMIKVEAAGRPSTLQPDKQIAPSVVQLLKNALGQTFVEYRKVMRKKPASSGQPKPPVSAAKPVEPVQSPVATEKPIDPVQAPIATVKPVEPTSNPVAQKTVELAENTVAVENSEIMEALYADNSALKNRLSAQKLSVLISRLEPSIFRDMKVGSQPILTGTERLTKESAGLLAEFWMYIQAAVQKIEGANNKTVAFQWATRDQMGQLKVNDIAKYRIFDAWIGKVLPGVINWADLQFDRESRISPALYVDHEDQDSFFVNAEWIAMPKKSAHMRSRVREGNMEPWELTMDEKGELTGFYKQEKERTRQWKQSDNTSFLQTAAERVNERCNGSLELVRADVEVVAFIKIYEAIYSGQKTAAPVNPQEEPAVPNPKTENGDSATATPAVLAAEPTTISSEEKSVLVPNDASEDEGPEDTSTLDETPLTIKKERRKKMRKVDGMSPKSLAGYLLDRHEVIVSQAPGRTDQFYVSLLREMYSHLASRKEQLAEDASALTALDSCAMQWLVALENRGDESLITVQGVRNTLIYGAEPENYLDAGRMLLDDFKNALPQKSCRQMLQFPEVQSLLQRIKKAKGDTIRIVEKFVNLGYNESKTRKALSQPLLIAAYTALETVEESLRQHQKIPDDISDAFLEVVILLHTIIRQTHALSDDLELTTLKPIPDYTGVVSTLFSQITGIVQKYETIVWEDSVDAPIPAEETTDVTEDASAAATEGNGQMEVTETELASESIQEDTVTPPNGEDHQFSDFENVHSGSTLTVNIIRRDANEEFMPPSTIESAPAEETIEATILQATLPSENTTTPDVPLVSVATPATQEVEPVTAPSVALVSPTPIPSANGLDVPALKGLIAQKRQTIEQEWQASDEMQRLNGIYEHVCGFGNQLKKLASLYDDDADLPDWIQIIETAEFAVENIFKPDEKPEHPTMETKIGLRFLSDEVTRIQQQSKRMEGLHQRLRDVEAQEETLATIERLQRELTDQIRILEAQLA